MCEKMAQKNKSMCRRHLLINRKRMRLWTEKNKEVNKERRSLRIGRGECPTCGEPSAPGRKQCRHHLALTNARGRAYGRSRKGRAKSKAWKERQPEKEYKEKRRKTAEKYFSGQGNGRFSFARGTAKVRGLAFEFTREEYYALISQGCDYCKFPVSKWGTGLDRLDNSKGYIPGNAVPCCTECNRARGDKFTPEETRILGRAIRRIKLARGKS